MSKINKDNFFNKEKLKLNDLSKSNINYLSDYWSQKGLKITENITIKIKPFFMEEGLQNLKNYHQSLSYVIQKFLAY